MSGRQRGKLASQSFEWADLCRLVSTCSNAAVLARRPTQTRQANQ